MSSRTGWGVFGANLALELTARGITPIPFIEPLDLELSPEKMAVLAPVLKLQKQATAMIPPEPERVLTCPYPLLHALGNGLTTTKVSRKLSGKPDIGMLFMEDARIDDVVRKRADRYRLILAGSQWNADLLRAGGIDHVQACPQGVDLTLFKPEGEARDFDGRFTVFSGGKLEYRKGQDIVIAAFRQLLEREPDALLAAAWHNYWPDPASWPTGHVTGQPRQGENRRLLLAEWVAANGIPARNFLDLGTPSNAEMATIFRGANVGLFTNRAEGGTNLVAMEAMASGLPVILSANTGHLDLISAGNCYPLTEQGPAIATDDFVAVDDWGESDPEAAAALLQQVHDIPSEATRIGLAGSRSLQQWSWSHRIDHMLELIRELG